MIEAGAIIATPVQPAVVSSTGGVADSGQVSLQQVSAAKPERKTVSRILGIDTSCDDTSIAVVADGTIILSNVVASQVDIHHRYGGVVPELACRKHIEAIELVYRSALDEAGLQLSDLDAIAVTQGPGLIGALLVGVSFAKSLAYAADKPLIPVNHLEGHICSAFLEDPTLACPFVCLVVSGGHTDLYDCAAPGAYRLLGHTRDDAAGEAFDKVSKLLGLGYPGGPVIDRLAREGDAQAIRFPRAYLEKDSLDFSFSGIKTAVLHYVRKHASPRLADLAASFQQAVVDVLVAKTLDAARQCQASRVVVSGGVAANSQLRCDMRAACAVAGLQLVIPHPRLCTDNGAMIAAAAYWRLQQGQLPLQHEALLDLDATTDEGLAGV
jgi:N6-L-threonylcarbamoyladenine synthase